METWFDFGVGELHGLRRKRDADDCAALPRSPPSAPSYIGIEVDSALANRALDLGVLQ